MYALNGLGDEEGVVHVGEQLKQIAGGRPGRVSESIYSNYDQGGMGSAGRACRKYC